MFKVHRQWMLSVIVIATSALLTSGGLAISSVAAANAASSPVPPFNQCPGIGDSPSCEILLVVNPDNSVSVVGDPSVGPFDGSDDTLVGIVNESSAAVKAVTVSGPGSDLSGFDGDGICSGDYGTWNGSAGCPYGPTGYEGPGTSFVTSPSLPDSAEVDFTGGLAPGGSAYFSLEGALVAAQLTAHKGALGFTVNGSIPVAHNSTQDTHAQDPKSKCNRVRFVADESLGQDAVELLLIPAPTAAGLLEHFLDGTGSERDFPNGSKISDAVNNSSEFKRLDKAIQAAVVSQLNSGNTTVKLTTGLRLIRLTSTPNLYFGFRGTQGLTVSGSGKVVGSNYVGTLTYVLRDSYGFTPNYSFVAIGKEMRYLQVNCGAPHFSLGAHWFPDSITVTVPFNQPVGSQPAVGGVKKRNEDSR
jgi:hypothetical protein